MNKVDSINQAIQCPYLVTFSMGKDLTESGFFEIVVVFEFVDDIRRPRVRTSLACRGVRTLELADIISGEAVVVGVRDMRLEQMEGIAYQVWDEEGGAFSLTCRELYWDENGS